MLRHRRLFHSRNVEEGRSFLQDTEFCLEEINPREVGSLDMHINGVPMPWGGGFGYFRYGLAVGVRAVGREDYWVQLPTRGAAEVVSASSSVICDARHAAVLSPTRTDYYLVRASGDCDRLCLSFRKNRIVEQLAVLLGEPPGKMLEFAPRMDVTLGHGLSLTRYLHMAVTDLESSGSILANPEALRAFEQLIMTGLLMCHPHSYSEAIQRLDKPVAPRDVKRAVDYIEANLNTSFTIADIVRATGVAGRTLFKQFKDFKGVSPMRYARDARFREVRRALLAAEPEHSVTDIATNWGFAHMGHLSVEYRRRFGESPSQTLRRRRQCRDAQ